MSDQPDFTENTDLSAALSPEDLADLGARTERILARPVPTEADLARLHELRESSFERVDDLVNEAQGGALSFDVSTAQGHIDALTLARRSLLNLGASIEDTQDSITLQDLFSDTHAMWEALTPQLQFNLFLEFMLGVVRLSKVDPDDVP